MQKRSWQTANAAFGTGTAARESLEYRAENRAIRSAKASIPAPGPLWSEQINEIWGPGVTVSTTAFGPSLPPPRAPVCRSVVHPSRRLSFASSCRRLPPSERDPVRGQNIFYGNGRPGTSVSVLATASTHLTRPLRTADRRRPDIRPVLFSAGA